jgi:hypothetical protein
LRGLKTAFLPPVIYISMRKARRREAGLLLISAGAGPGSGAAAYLQRLHNILPLKIRIIVQ